MPHFDSLDDCPEGLRRLLEAKLKGNGGAPGSARPTETSSAAAAAPSPCAGKAEKKPKYGNKPTERIAPGGGVIKFDSKKEAARYDWLMQELAQGRIRDLKLQYQILIQPSFTDPETGEHTRAISYLADFRYMRQNDAGAWEEVIEDTKGGSGRKGTQTDTFRLKKKLLAERGIRVVTV